RRTMQLIRGLACGVLLACAPDPSRIEEIAPVELSALAPGDGAFLTILPIWASWCKPCLDELKALGGQSLDSNDSTLRVIALNVDHPEQSATARRMLAEVAPDLVSLYHEDGATAAARKMVPNWDGALPLAIVRFANTRRSFAIYGARPAAFWTEYIRSATQAATAGPRGSRTAATE
ncbi:MAG: hypothetical protein RIF32_17215, partial [Leptospirales bacterium]